MLTAKRIAAGPARTQGKWIAPTNGRNWSQNAPRPEIQAKFRFAWRAEQLIREVEVVDERPVIAPDATPLWQFDSIQLGVQKIGAAGMPGPARAFLEVAAGQTGEGEKFYVYRDLIAPKKGVKRGISAEIARQGKLTTYWLKIDSTELGGELKAGDLLGFSLRVNDNAGAGRRGYLYFGDGIGDSKSAQEFQQLELVK